MNSRHLGLVTPNANTRTAPARYDAASSKAVELVAELDKIERFRGELLISVPDDGEAALELEFRRDLSEQALRDGFANEELREYCDPVPANCPVQEILMA